eukprot:scaffold376_cov354-Prasinococcus_capsulatus_cf.AAC.2
MLSGPPGTSRWRGGGGVALFPHLSATIVRTVYLSAVQLSADLLQGVRSLQTTRFDIAACKGLSTKETTVRHAASTHYYHVRRPMP